MKIRWWIYAILALCWGTLAVSSVSAGQRVALVIGNSKYRNVDRLPKTINDAMAMVALFHKAGFDVVKWRVDLDVTEFRRTVRDFMVTAQSADIAVVYYAGHGIEQGGTNYLIPVDAKLLSDYDADDEAISLDRIILALQPARQLRLIILDACRENPFSARGNRSIVTRAIANGLAKIEPSTPDTLIAYAAKAGSLSYEGNGPNSPFTTALVKHLAEPGLDIRLALGKVRDEVLKNTGNRQEPFVYGSLGGDAVSLVSAPEPKASRPAAAAVDPNLAAQRDYEMAERVQTPQAWESFLAVHSNGFYADLAREQLGKLIAAQTAAEAAANAETLTVKNIDEILGVLKDKRSSPTMTEEAAKPTDVQPHDVPAGGTDSRGQEEGWRERERQAALVQGKGESVESCKAAEERLVRLRADPKQEEVDRFAHDLVCETLRPQLLRLLESLGAPLTTTLPPGAAHTATPPAARSHTGQSGIAGPRPQTEVEKSNVQRKPGGRHEAETDGQDICKRDEATLARLRASPERAAVIGFAGKLACAQLRPQLERLLESLGD
jgi:Caspase domain